VAQIATEEAERRKRLMRGVMAPLPLRPAAVTIAVAPEPVDEQEDPPLLAVAN